MTAKDNIEEKLSNLSNAIGSDEKLAENVMSRIKNESNFGRSQAKTQNIWRIIMKSPLTKLVAAAVIIIAVTFGLFNVEFNNRAYGITDVPEIIRQADTIHIKTWTKTNISFINEEDSNQDRQYLEDWIDLKNGKYHQMGFGLVSEIGTNTARAIKLGFVFDGRYRMQVNHSNKNVQFYKSSEFQRTLSVRQLTDKFLEEIYLSEDEMTGFTQSNTEQIEGISYEVWEKIQNASDSSENKLEYWISPSSGKIRKYQQWKNNLETNGQWQLTYEKEIFINQTPPEGIFNTEVPEGYHSANSRETALIDKLIAYPIRLGSLTGEINIIISLSNGTVIMAWNTNDISQVELLENLSPGDEIPEIPLKLKYDLREDNNPDNITYEVRHLTLTKKEHVSYEWYIYVPSKDLSDTNLSREYQMYQGLHTTDYNEADWTGANFREGQINWIGPFLSKVALIIQDKDEFNTFVLGAMAELSDDGQAPEGVTYEKVLRLAQQIRESSAK